MSNPGDWTYREVGTNFQPLDIDFGQPGGELFRPPGNGAIDFNVSGGGVDDLTDTFATYLASQQVYAEAQGRFNRMMANHPELRNYAFTVDSEVLPPESYDEMLQNRGMKSARPIDEMPPDLSDVYNGRPSSNHGFGRTASTTPTTIDVPARSADDVLRASSAIPAPARLSRLASRGVRVVSHPAFGGAIELGAGLASGDSLPRAAVGALGSTAGGFAGAHIGGALGGAIGSIVPIVGTAAGAGVGALIGGWIGGQIGGDANRRAFDALFPNASPEQQGALAPAPGVLPFTGGQSPGVLYKVSAQVVYESRAVGFSSELSTGEWVANWVPGPIGNIAIEVTTNEERVVVDCATDSYYAPNGRKVITSLSKPRATSPVIKSFTPTITRIDGQPDTGGNPAATPTTPIAPSSPLLRHSENTRYNPYYPAPMPQASPRGDSPYHPTSPRLAPGQSAPTPTPNVPHLPALQTPIAPRNLSNPQQLLEPPGSPSDAPFSLNRTLSLPDPEDGWVPGFAVPDLTRTSPQPQQPLVRWDRNLQLPRLSNNNPGKRPSTLPGLTTSTMLDTPTGTRTDTQTNRAIGTGIDTPIPPTQPLTTTSECNFQKPLDCDPCNLLNQIKNALLEKITLNLEYNNCNSDEPEKYTITESRLTAIARALEKSDKFNDERDKHACELSPAIPESWAWKVKDRPQLVIQFAEVSTQGKSSRWSFAIPHYRFGSSHKPNIPQYTHGNITGTLILNDNSQVVVNCKDEQEFNTFITAIKLLINPAMLTNAIQKTTKRQGRTIEQKKLKPVYGKYFSTGQQNLIPDWIIRF